VANLRQSVERLFRANEHTGRFIEDQAPASAASLPTTFAGVNVKHEWPRIFTGAILMDVLNRVLILTHGIETNDHRLFFASWELLLSPNGRAMALKLYYKVWILMCVSPQLEGAALLGIARNWHIVGIGHCDNCAEVPVRLRRVWHNSLALWGKVMLLKLARVAEADRIVRRIYSTDARRRQFSYAKRLARRHLRPATRAISDTSLQRWLVRHQPHYRSSHPGNYFVEVVIDFACSISR
jgi:hypothetical protein